MLHNVVASNHPKQKIGQNCTCFSFRNICFQHCFTSKHGKTRKRSTIDCNSQHCAIYFCIVQCTYTSGTVYVCTAVQEQSHHVGPTPFACHMKWCNRILKYKSFRTSFWSYFLYIIFYSRMCRHMVVLHKNELPNVNSTD